MLMESNEWEKDLIVFRVKKSLSSGKLLYLVVIAAQFCAHVP